MSDDPSWLSFGADAASTAAPAAADTGLAAGQLAGGAIGAGELAGTTAEGLNGIGSIAPGALEAGNLSGAGINLLQGSEGVGGGVPAIPGSVAAGAPSGGVPVASGGVPIAGSPGAIASGTLGGAAGGAAPVSAPVSPTTSGELGGVPLLKEDTTGLSGPVAGLKGVTADPGVASGGGLSSGALTAPSSVGAAVPPPTAPASAPGPIDKFISDPSLGNAWGVAKADGPMLLSLGGIGANLLRGNQPLPGEDQLKTTASQLGSQAQTLESYLQTGTLPPGVSAGLTSAGSAAKATIRSRHAASGTSGSSSEAQELSAVDSQMQTQGANIALNLLQTGLNESQMSSELYKTILQGALSEDQQLGQAIGQFSSALVGAPTINIGARV